MFKIFRSCQFQKLKLLEEFKEYEKSDRGKEANLGSVDPIQEELSPVDIREYIENDRLFGLVKCGLKLPPSQYERCLELSPLFAHRTVTCETLQQPLDERLKQFYPYRPAEDKNEAMSNYADLYGIK